MVEIVKLERWHLEVLLSEGYIEPDVYSVCYANYNFEQPSITVLVDGVVCGCGGIFELWDGVAEGWSILTNRMKQKPKTLVTAFKKYFACIENDYYRIQITVDEEDHTAVKFAEYLGFTFEGRMLYYGPNKETHLRYARLYHG